MKKETGSKFKVLGLSLVILAMVFLMKSTENIPVFKFVITFTIIVVAVIFINVEVWKKPTGKNSEKS